MMRQNEKDLLTQYIYNNYVRLEDQLNTLQNNIRFRNNNKDNNNKQDIVLSNKS